MNAAPDTDFEKLTALSEGNASGWLVANTYRAENQGWLEMTFAIAVLVGTFIKDKGITQKELAKRCGFSEQHVSSLLKGKDNLSLETIYKLEKALQLELVHIEGRNMYSPEPYLRPKAAETDPGNNGKAPGKTRTEAA